MVVFRERTFGHQKHQHPASPAPKTVRSGAQPAQVPSFSPPATGGAVSPAPAARRRNWSCRTEAGGAGPDGAWKDPGGKAESLWLCCPSPGPGAPRGARPGCCEGSGRYGAGRPPRPGRLRWRVSASDSLGGNRWRKPSGSLS